MLSLGLYLGTSVTGPPRVEVSALAAQAALGAVDGVEPGDAVELTLNSTDPTAVTLFVDATSGTLYWMIDGNASRTAAQIITGGGEASGSTVITDNNIDLGAVAAAVAPGSYHFHAVAVVGAVESNVVSDTMTIEAVVVTFVGATVGTTSLAIPAGATEGDMMVMFTASDSEDTTEVTGWTALAQQTNGALRVRRLWKVIGAGEGAITTGAQRGIVGVWRNAAFAHNVIYDAFFDNKTRLPAYDVGTGNTPELDVSGEMFRAVFWASLFTTDDQSNESPPGVTKRAGHNSITGDFRLWLGDATHDSATAFSGGPSTPAASDASRSAWIAKLRTT